MFSTNHQSLKTQIVNACLEIFPEAQSIILWGSCVTPDFSPAVNDIDLILEIDLDFSQEVVLAERLKSLIAITSFCRLDPFVYLTKGNPDKPLEFIAPFGFYKANPFIPYLLQNEQEVVYGTSTLLKRLPPVSLAQALAGTLPAVMGALKRLRMDVQSEGAFMPLFAKHKASLFVIARTYFAYEQGGVGSKKEALRFLTKKLPQYAPLVDQLWLSLEADRQPPSAEPSAELVLDFVKTLEAYFLVKRYPNAQ